MKIECPECLGSGEIDCSDYYGEAAGWINIRAICDVCHGTGYIEQEDTDDEQGRKPNNPG